MQCIKSGSQQTFSNEQFYRGDFYRANRTCKCGCGTEKTKGECDTPGFPLTTNPEIKTDHRRTKRLYMPRNHPRLNQTSRYLLQSWRANCDVQILVYDSSPSKPNLAEIAKITDYVVSYQCKGNHSWKEEQEQMKKLVLAAEDILGDKHDLRRVAKQVMNKVSSKRIISKQEAMVLLGDLDLTYCTETIESVSINNSTRLKEGPENKTDTRFTTQYSNRPHECEEMSLYDYFLFLKNDGKNGRKGRKYIIPNFIGFSGNPQFPVKEPYARHTIITYTPWRKYPVNRNWLAEFETYIHTRKCLPSCRLAYDRVMLRHYHNLSYYEATASRADHSRNTIPDDIEELMTLVGLTAAEVDDAETKRMNSLDKGKEYDWDRDPIVSKNRDLKYKLQKAAKISRYLLLRTEVPDLMQCIKLGTQNDTMFALNTSFHEQNLTKQFYFTEAKYT